MPQIDDDIKKGNDSLRILAYGPAKTRKTLFAGTAAEAGFNVLLLDCDNGFQILRHLSPEARKRIYRIDIVDTMKASIACSFMSLFCKYTKFTYNQEKRTALSAPTQSQIDEFGDALITIDHEKLKGNTVVMLDSYTALADSIARQYSIENGIDLSEADKPEWDGYGWCGRLATWMLNQLKVSGLPLIVIGHEDVYEKVKKKPGKKQRASDTEIEFIRKQPKSVSRAHSMTIANKFDEVLEFYLVGESTMIKVTPDPDSDAGGRIIKPGKYQYKDLTYPKICELAGITPPLNAPYLSELLKPEVKKSMLTSRKEVVNPEPALKKGGVINLKSK